MVRSYARGFTLTELVIVIAILGIFAVSVVPLGTSWVANTQLEKTQRLLVEAYTKATTEAIKNPNGKLQTDSNPMVATLSIDNTTDSISVTDSAGTSIWQVYYPGLVSITFSGSTCTSIQLNNNAARIGTACTGGYTLSRTGAANVTGQF